MNLKIQRARLLAAARQTAEKAHGQNRSFTQTEHSRIESALKQVDLIDVRLKSGDTPAGIDDPAMKALSTLNAWALDNASGDDEEKSESSWLTKLRRVTSGEDLGAGDTRYLKFDPQALGKAYVRGRQAAPDFGAKSLLDTGTTIVQVPLADSPVTSGRPAQGLLDVLPAQQTARDYSYLRQSARTVNADWVASGGLKPTSVSTLGRITGRLRVLAHLSEAVDKYWLEDNSSLTQFVSDELLYGLRMKLEAAVLNGTGVGEIPTGINATSGIQTQAFVTSIILTARAALTKVELIFDEAPSYFVFNPVDWEKIETSLLSSGGYLMTDAGASAPIDRVQRRLWGQPVALSLAVTAGTGWLINRDAATLYTDTSGIEIAWAMAADDFTRNQVRARCEGRFDVAVPRPLGIVKMTLTA